MGEELMKQGEASTEGTKAAPSPAASTATTKYLFAGAIVLLLVLGTLLAWNLLREPTAPVSPMAADQLIRIGRFDEAERIVRQLLEMEPDSTENQFLLARVLAARGRLKEAAEVLESIEGDPVVRAEALFRAAQAWLEAGYRRKAEAAFYRTLEVQTDHPNVGILDIHQEVRRQLAGMYAFERRRPDFRRITWETYRNDPPELRHEPLASRLRYEIEMVEPSVAIAKLEPALELDPNDLYTRRALGIYHLEAGNASQARAYLIRCVQDDPENVLMWEAWLRCLARVGEQLQIERALKDIPESAAKSDICWRFRSQLLALLGQTEEAAKAAEEAVKLNPFSSENHYQLGQMLQRLGQAEAAQKHIQRSKELQEIWQQLLETFARFRNEWDLMVDDQERCELAFQLGQLCEQIGWYKDAYGWYDVALHQVPTHGPSIAARERLQEKVGE